ncbi:hypothetical protein RGK87_04750 [Agrobacterium fabacearum]|uniref:hypothetical protein n=1 Tax=Agrobacterium tumefaciens TaxID=358 RepID=UPI0028535C39|nr:hypothetical protein [Agrobacterium tumefaciens]MDR5008316.1 hypothetical protein [Agrobacterium tumefaciens]
MKIFAVFDDGGMPKGFYPEDVFGPFEIDGERNPSLPLDAIEISEDQWIDLARNQGYRRFVDGEVVVVDPSTTPPNITDYENAIQDLVDSTARERQFRDGVTLASYIGSTKPKWAAEAQAFVAWRDNVWFYAYGELDKVQAGQRPQPTVEQFLGEIAPIAWPT